MVVIDHMVDGVNSTFGAGVNVFLVGVHLVLAPFRRFDAGNWRLDKLMFRNLYILFLAWHNPKIAFKMMQESHALFGSSLQPLASSFL
jgi:hypothetical protein